MLHGVQLISKPNISQNGLIYLARLQLADEGAPLEAIRARFADFFEELDGDYYDAADEDLAAAAEYVQANLAKFLA